MTPTARQVFETLAEEFLGRPGSSRRTMFGRDCLLHDGHQVAFLHDDRLTLRLPPDRVAALLDGGAAEVPMMGTREMRGWAAVGPPDGPEATERWRALLAEALAEYG